LFGGLAENFCDRSRRFELGDAAFEEAWTQGLELPEKEALSLASRCLA
jgi:hypothetical protein